MASALGHVGASNRCDPEGVLNPKGGDEIVAMADSMNGSRGIGGAVGIAGWDIFPERRVTLRC